MKNLKIPIAFLTVIAIWTSTPLAIQWSSGGAPLTSVLLRMMIGIIFCLCMMAIMKTKLPFNADARKLYLVGGLSIYGSMALVYMAAQTIPSGWISIVFGLSPLITGVIAAFVEPSSRLTTVRIVGILLGLSGLVLVFQAGLTVSGDTIFGIAMLLISVFISAGSSVIIRQLSHNNTLLPMQTTVGSLFVAIPLFTVTALLFEPITEITYSSRALISILYLGLVGTGVGFTLYYYLLKNMAASKVAMIMLVTPITALLLGNLLNNEPVIREVWIGAILVCTGLLLYEHKPRFGLRKL